ncbi:MAG: PAS domain-containing protein [Planctomycetales bacterium]|nr:PAS domain-containing protein [Planctomycetales bacterium]
MESPSYRRVLLLTFVLYTSVAIGVVYWVGMRLRKDWVDTIEADLHGTEKQLLIVLEQQPELGLLQVDQFPTPSIRVAVLDERGETLAASPNVLVRDALGERPDVREAWRDGRGRFVRQADGDAPASIAISRRFTIIKPRPPELDSENAEPSTTDVDGLEERAAESRVLRVSTNLDNLDRHIVTLRWYIASAAGLLGVGIFWSFGSIAQAVLAPLPRLVRFARSLAEGNLDVTLDLETRQAEWTSLSNAFDQMRLLLGTREQTLRDYGHRLETTLASMAEGVIAVAGDGTVAFANAAAIRLLSITQTNPAGKRLYDLVRLPQLIEAYEQSVARVQSAKAEFETLGASRRVLSLRVDPIPGAPSPGSVLVLRDVTEIRQLETMRRDFVANVSHELKTPLSAIKAYAETLRMGAWDDLENRPRFVDEIETQAERLYSLILDLIQLARIESEDFTIVKEPVDLGEIIEEAIAPFLRVARSHQVELEVIHVDDGVHAYSDPDSLVTIIDNLVSNAIRYTKAGGQVTLRYGGDETNAWIEVADTGIGIAPEHQTRVFERFYRVDRARSRDVGGTGLGLSIVKHLSQALDGSIELSSKVGVGTRIRVVLPASKQ